MIAPSYYEKGVPYYLAESVMGLTGKEFPCKITPSGHWSNDLRFSSFSQLLEGMRTPTHSVFLTKTKDGFYRFEVSQSTR
ncbi:MAG: hypothetical protein PHT54_05155 [Candidatus Nanoarchaeia archaeon]|nr:hypothetical protein [Candidatus Nanoarchaeia archaeon]